MELNWLDDFIALAEYESFSRAAKFRNITQPAFSRRIRSLEEWLGVDLFTRTYQGATLTPAGREVLSSAQELSRRFYQLRTKAREAAGKEQHLLRFAATYSLSFTFFPRWIRSLDSKALFESIRLTTESMKTCEQMLINGDSSFLLCHCHPDIPTKLPGEHFVCKTIGLEYLVPVIGNAPSFNTDPQKQDPIPFLKFSSDSALGRILDKKLLDFSTELNLEVIFESHLSPVLLSMAMENKGVAWLPKSIIENELSNGKLQVAFSEEFHIPLKIRLYRPVGNLGLFIEGFWASIPENME
ncbi:DNA-binding transcriptional regulator, LysR family [Azotobacter beijerinckii]|uniref:DNA-binding transcriptional regulator, LysR family n=1 Tax=Azotobacter beijerinckii TaxID=170623 RepID=A0A1H6Y2D8_9GAMM|nr:LysR family transcriptional regulator [Azotobacter beijerinckii]SEJ31280.1 DNA-binding transcriptional regulator, LysR family [Azotobacter beijerinckii]SEJ40804.1 DNA-binding transcriptional regulator, LysR family [Azotobacter beijerinckii]